MNIFDIILIGISLSMDAFAVSICKGMNSYKNNYKKALIIGFYFGLFQSIMPFIGYLLGFNFHNIIENIDHWIAFVLLLIIGLKMIKSALLDDNNLDNKSNFKTMIPLAIATSIDALVIGITLSFLNVNIIFSSICIGIITFVLSFIGVIIGSKVKEYFGIKAQIVGGLLLIVIGVKILFEHLNLI